MELSRKCAYPVRANFGEPASNRQAILGCCPEQGHNECYLDRYRTPHRHSDGGGRQVLVADSLTVVGAGSSR
jgi:hypothetical protein